MVNVCYIHLFGGGKVIEMAIEERLAKSNAEPARAASTTYDALDKWERTLLADVNGRLERARDQFGTCRESARQALAQWKQAERAQVELIAFANQVDDDALIRPDVREELESQSAGTHVRRARADGRFPNVSLRNSDSMVEIGSDLLGIEPADDEVLPADDAADGTAELVQLFRMDLRAIQRIKVGMRAFIEALNAAETHVEEARVFETLQHRTHESSDGYPVSEAAARLRTAIQEYELFTEAYGSYVTRATKSADGDLWDEVTAYAGSADPESVLAGPEPSIDPDDGSVSMSADD